MADYSPGPSRSRGPLSLVVKLRCQYCGVAIETPFARGRGETPVYNCHPKPGAHSPRCRVVVIVDPQGERHEMHQVRDGESRDEALERVARKLAA